MAATHDEKQTRRVMDGGKCLAMRDREDGGYRDEEAIRNHATDIAQSNVDDLSSGSDDPQGYVTTFVELYVKGYFAEIKFHEEIMAQGKRWSAEHKVIQEQAIAAMTPQKAAEIVHAASEIIGLEYMPLLAQLAIVEKWLKRKEVK